MALMAGTVMGCGQTANKPAVCESPAESVAVSSSAETSTIEAKLVSFDGTWLIFEYEGTKYSLSLSEAMINTTTLRAGDTLIITYSGTLSAEDASTCRVLSIATRDDGNNDSHELVGTLEDITMNAITVRVNDGRIITFNATNAKHSFSYGVDEGNWVTIIYNGDLVGTDTTNIAVTRIHDEDTDHVKEVKAQTTIQEVEDTVYALQDAGVRASYMMASEFLGTLNARQGIQRTGICNNGWERVIFNGREAFIYGKLLTTDPNEVGMQGTTVDISQKVKIKDLRETVYAKTDANVRLGYSTAAKSIGALKAGASATRTGICDNGWSRILYKGNVAYVYSDLLTTKNPNTEKEGVKITAVAEPVYIVSDANVRKSWSKDSEVVGTLVIGDSVLRTGICDNGWSRIVFKEQDAYINSDLISKTNPLEVETVTIYRAFGSAWTSMDVEVRESFSASSRSLGIIPKGTKLDINGVTDSDWARFNFLDTVGYIHNDMLTTVDPNPGTPTATPTPTPKPTATNKPAKKPMATDKPTATPTSTDKLTVPPTAAPSPEEVVEPAPAVDPETEDTQDIIGIVAGYDLYSVTIAVAQDTSGSTGSGRAADEPDFGLENNDEYPSITYADAEGVENTYYTFDLSSAAQEYEQGISEGIAVKVTYVGELSSMSAVRAVRVTDVGVPQPAPVPDDQDVTPAPDESREETAPFADESEAEKPSEDESGAEKPIEDQSEAESDKSKAAEPEGAAEEQIDETSLEGQETESETAAEDITEAKPEEAAEDTFDEGSEEPETADAEPAEEEAYEEPAPVEVPEETQQTPAEVPEEVQPAPAAGESEGRTFRGIVDSCTENMVTVILEDSVKCMFNFENAHIDKANLTPGARVKVIADFTDIKPEDNVYKAVKIEIEP